MESYGVGSVRDDIEAVDTACERFFNVGEVVEYWEGAYVRGERIGFGEPAFVKKVEGNGVYAIKMVGSCRGKFRKVGWRSLFKDGSFNKKGVRGDGARVRGETRLKEMAKEEAEAKLGVELKDTRKQLKKIERLGEDRLREQEREAIKAEKALTGGHKRELAAMREDLERTREEDVQNQEELVRQSRVKVRRITKELAHAQQHLLETEETNVGLAKAVKTSTAKLNNLREEGSRWKGKYMAVAGDVRARTRDMQKELDEKKQDLVAIEDTNGVLVKAVSKGITKCKRVMVDGLRWKTQYKEVQAELRETRAKLTEAEQAIRDMSKAGESGKKRDADLRAELVSQLVKAEMQAKVFSSTCVSFSYSLPWLFLLASCNSFHLFFSF